MANLYNSAEEGVDTNDVLSNTAGYEPKAHDFCELLNSPVLLSYTTPTADPDYDDATLEDMLHQVHRAQVYHSVREDLSVSLSLSSMSDRTGQPVGDRPGQPGEHKSSETQIRTLLDEPRNIQHELHAAHAEEEQRLLQGLLWQQKLEFREAHQRGLTEMEELRKFHNSAFRTLYWNFLAEYRNCKMK